MPTQPVPTSSVAVGTQRSSDPSQSGGELIAGPAECESEEFRVDVPAGWYTHEATADVPACFYFATQPFAVTSHNRAPSVPVTVGVNRVGGIGFAGETPTESRDITFSGLPGARYEFSATGGAEQDGRAGLWYGIFVDGAIPTPERQLRVLSVNVSALPGEYEAYRSTFIGMVGSIEMLDGTTEAAREAEVARLFAETDTCQREDIDLVVEFPDDWYANTAYEDVPACSYFAPRSYEITDPEQLPEGVEIAVRLQEGGDLGRIGEMVVRDELTINGWPVLRTEEVGPGIFLNVGERVFQYVVGVNGALPSETNTQPYLLISTSTSMEGDYPLARAVLDELVLRLNTDGAE